MWCVLNTLFCFAGSVSISQDEIPGANAIFYLLLVTYIMPSALTAIPSYILAVKSFIITTTFRLQIFPYLATVFNIFLLRQAFKGVPDDLLDAGQDRWRQRIENLVEYRHAGRSPFACYGRNHHIRRAVE